MNIEQQFIIALIAIAGFIFIGAHSMLQFMISIELKDWGPTEAVRGSLKNSYILFFVLIMIYAILSPYKELSTVSYKICFWMQVVWIAANTIFITKQLWRHNQN